MPSVIASVAGEQRATELENVSVMVAGAPPPAVVVEAIARFGWYVAHVYGMTESYGPAIFIERQPERDRLDLGARRALKVRQGLRGPMLEDVMVADSETTTQVPTMRSRSVNCSCQATR